jgi:hypothetical protein
MAELVDDHPRILLIRAVCVEPTEVHGRFVGRDHQVVCAQIRPRTTLQEGDADLCIARVDELEIDSGVVLPLLGVRLDLGLDRGVTIEELDPQRPSGPPALLDCESELHGAAAVPAPNRLTRANGGVVGILLDSGECRVDEFLGGNVEARADGEFGERSFVVRCFGHDVLLSP